MTYLDWLAQQDLENCTFKEAFQAGAASRDAEVTSLTNQRDYEFVRAENALMERDQLIAEIERKMSAGGFVLKENDQLREQMALLRESIKFWMRAEGNYGLMRADAKFQEARAATEPKP